MSVDNLCRKNQMPHIGPALRLSEYFSRHNVFYLLSACLMLLGCFLVCLPLLFQHRELDGLLHLLGAINLYEALVVLAAGYILRRLPASREGATLVLIELLFLFDATFTINACPPVQATGGLVILQASLILSVIKLWALEATTEAPVFLGLRGFLLPALVFLYSFQGLWLVQPENRPDARAAAAFGTWLAFGTLPLLLWRTPLEIVVEGSPHPAWQGRAFRSKAICLPLCLLGLQLAGQSWVYRMPWGWESVAPILISLAAVCPIFLRAGARWTYDLERLLATAAALALAALFRGDAVWLLPFRSQEWSLTPLRLDLLYAAGVLVLVWRRERAAFQFDAACLALAAAFLVYDPNALTSYFARPDLSHTLALSLVAAGWLRVRGTYGRGITLCWTLLGLGLWGWSTADHAVRPWLEFVRYAPVLALASACLWPCPRGWRYVWLAMIFMLGVGSSSILDASALAYFYVAATAITALMALEGRRLIAPLFAYLLLGNAALFPPPLPNSAAHWGWVVILLAFGSFGLAFWITRRRLPPASR